VMAPVRVLLADDHALVRSGLRALVEHLPGTEVVGEAADGREALAVIEQERPDVVLMDVTMPELSGLEAAERVRERFPDVRILIVSMHANPMYVSRALQVGASGYVLKTADAGELEEAVRRVSRGLTYLCPAAARALEKARERGAEGEEPALTPRQREILQLVAEGHSTRKIAGKLGLSVKTVETHRAHLMERLGIRDVAGLVRYAVRVGLVSPDT
jgi:DNA-binding NarL/FixJ family response regulator